MSEERSLERNKQSPFTPSPLNPILIWHASKPNCKHFMTYFIYTANIVIGRSVKAILLNHNNFHLANNYSRTANWNSSLLRCHWFCIRNGFISSNREKIFENIKTFKSTGNARKLRFCFARIGKILKIITWLCLHLKLGIGEINYMLCRVP